MAQRKTYNKEFKAEAVIQEVYLLFKVETALCSNGVVVTFDLVITLSAFS